MTHATGQPSGEDRLLALIYELIDAHRDTADLRLEGAGELRWEAHLDYLRALQRRATEILAHSDPGLEHAWEPGRPR